VNEMRSATSGSIIRENFGMSKKILPAENAGEQEIAVAYAGFKRRESTRAPQRTLSDAVFGSAQRAIGRNS